MLAFAKVFLRLKAKLPEAYRVHYIVHPAGLEDNLTDKAYDNIRALARTILGARKDITLARNALHFKQYPYPVESHDFSLSGLSKLKAGDIISADGSLLQLHTNCPGMDDYSIRQIMERAEAKGVTVLLWRPEWSGMSACGKIQPAWNNRHYDLVGRSFVKQLLGE